MVSRQVSSLVASLTRAEKLTLVHGALDPAGTATGYLPGVERLGIPELRLTDGPLGVRTPGERATAFPSGLSLAATFDPSLAERQGAALGREARARGQHVLLGPGLNLVRVPNCGRNFEYFSEDPTLTAAFAGGVVSGIESEDVVATPKHYVANNQERGRARVSADVSERALRECYLPGFRAAVEAGAGAVMSSYNRVNGTHASDNRHLLTDVLKGEWGFDGFVVSDWYGSDDAATAANAGLDVEMPGVTPEAMAEAFDMDGDMGDFDDGTGSMPTPAADTPAFGDPLDEAVDAGEVPEARLDDMVARVLTSMESIGLLDGAWGGGELDTPRHRDLAETVAARGCVLLDNRGVLPLADDAALAVLGSAAGDATLGGGGSSETTPFVETATVDGLRGRAGGDVTYESGVPAVETPSFFSGGADDADAADAADDASDFDAAVTAARGADVAVVVVRDAVGEAMDRDSLALPGEQDELVEAVADVADETVVVVQSSGPVETPWRDAVDAVVETWYPGQADGDAVAAVLYGDVDPAGRLPVTFAPADAYPTADDRAYPGVDDVAHYDEGVFVGHPHFDRAGVDPTYPFGHGLSYADFDYGDAERADDRTVRVPVTNTGDRDGREVVQAYVRPPDVEGVERPFQRLGGFESVAVPAGETVAVEVSLDGLAFSRYDDASGWVVDPGTYEIAVGRSSRDVRATVDVTR